jgi:peptide/nickel transport system permease protein
MFHGSLGQSLTSQYNVTTMLGARLPVTAELLLYAFVVSLVLAVGLAVLVARWPNGIMDRFSLVISMTGLSIAPYVLGLVLVYLLAVKVHWFPALGYTSPSVNPVENIKSLTVPTVSLGFPLFAVYTRLLARTSSSRCSARTTS